MEDGAACGVWSPPSSCGVAASPAGGWDSSPPPSHFSPLERSCHWVASGHIKLFVLVMKSVCCEPGEAWRYLVELEAGWRWPAASLWPERRLPTEGSAPASWLFISQDTLSGPPQLWPTVAIKWVSHKYCLSISIEIWLNLRLKYFSLQSYNSGITSPCSADLQLQLHLQLFFLNLVNITKRLDVINT